MLRAPLSLLLTCFALWMGQAVASGPGAGLTLTGTLINLNGAAVGQVLLERVAGHRFLHVTRAQRVAGTGLEVWMSHLPDR